VFEKEFSKYISFNGFLSVPFEFRQYVLLTVLRRPLTTGRVFPLFGDTLCVRYTCLQFCYVCTCVQYLKHFQQYQYVRGLGHSRPCTADCARLYLATVTTTA
jgi:hypothetical protein